MTGPLMPLAGPGGRPGATEPRPRVSVEGRADSEPSMGRAGPPILDLFCCAGGMAKGYDDAGLAPYGVDIDPQPNYPYPFHQGDAIDVLRRLKAGEAVPFTHRDGTVEWMRLEDFAAVHASPTCQTFARVTDWRGSRDDHPDLLTPTMAELAGITLPWIVENVPEAPLRADYLLCGTQFGLRVRRHRIFQRGNWDAYSLLPPCRCHRNPDLLPFEHKGERAFADAMGCTWMTNREGRQAIPPAYAEHIGTELLAWLTEEAA